MADILGGLGGLFSGAGEGLRLYISLLEAEKEAKRRKDEAEAERGHRTRLAAGEQLHASVENRFKTMAAERAAKLANTQENERLRQQLEQQELLEQGRNYREMGVLADIPALRQQRIADQPGPVAEVPGLPGMTGQIQSALRTASDVNAGQRSRMISEARNEALRTRGSVPVEGYPGFIASAKEFDPSLASYRSGMGDASEARARGMAQQLAQKRVDSEKRSIMDAEGYDRMLVTDPKRQEIDIRLKSIDAKLLPYTEEALQVMGLSNTAPASQKPMTAAEYFQKLQMIR